MAGTTGRLLLFQRPRKPGHPEHPYGLLRDLFAYRFAIQDSDPPPVVRASLEKGIGDALGIGPLIDLPDEPHGEPAEQRQVQMKTHFIARLLGFEIGSSKFLPEADPRQIQERGLAYLGEYFQALADEKSSGDPARRFALGG